MGGPRIQASSGAGVAAPAGPRVPAVPTAPAPAGEPDAGAPHGGDAERWAALLSVVQASVSRMNRLSTLAEIGEAVVEETRRVIDYHNCRVYVVEGPDRVVPIAFRGEVGTYEEIPMELLVTRLGEGFTGWVALHGEPILVDDANADPRGATIAGTDEVDESMVVVPMLYDERVIGVITLSKLGLAQFDERDLRLMLILADAAATAIQSARSLEEARRLADRLQALLAMSSDLTRSLDPREVGDVMARHLANATGVDECGICYWDRSSDTFLTLGYFPPEGRERVEDVYPVSDYPESRRAMVEQATVILDVDDPAVPASEADYLRAMGQQVSAVLPLIYKGEPVGIVELNATRHMEFDSDRLQLARTMANEAAMALENARLYEAARALADRDPLTEFYNHRYLQERLAEELLRATRTRRPLALLMVDLDDFKLVNDTLGHQVGDGVLRWTADLIRDALRTTDIPARYGGDEFAIILPDTDVETAKVAAQRLLAAFEQEPFRAPGRGEVPIGLSIGLAGAPASGRTARELIEAADQALYHVKRAGGGGLALAGGPRRGRAPDLVALDGTGTHGLPALETASGA